MLLTSLKLENIRSYVSQVINFPNGSVLLSGDIGSGKSTILLAIEFALFGILRTELSGSSLLRNGETKGSVELSFRIDETSYVIKRTLKKSKDTVTQESGYIVTDETKFEGTPIELKSKILEILGYPESMLSGSKSLIYRFTVYTAQEQMKHIIFEDKETRLNTLRKVFGIDKYKLIKDNSTILTRELKSRKNEISSKLEKENVTKKQLLEKNLQKESLGNEITGSLAELGKLKEELAAEKKAADEIEQKAKEFLEIKKELELNDISIREKVSKRDDLIKKINPDGLKSLENKLSSFLGIFALIDEKPLESELIQVEERYRILSSEKAAYDEKKKGIKKRISENEEELSSFEKLKEEFEKLKTKILEGKEILKVKENQEIMFEEAKEKEKSIYFEIERLNEKIKETIDLENFIKETENCPTCRQGISHDHKIKIGKEHEILLEKLEYEKIIKTEETEKVKGESTKIISSIKRLDELQKEIEKETENLLRLESKITVLKKKDEELGKLKEELKELEMKKIEDDETLKSSLISLKEKVISARVNNQKFMEKENTLKLIESERKSLEEKENLVKALDSEIEKKARSSEILRDRSKSLEEINSMFVIQKQKVEFIQSREKGIEIKMNVKKQELKNAEERIKELENETLEFSRLKEKLEELAKLQNWVEDFFIKLMTTIEKHVMISIHREFNSLLKDWFSLLIEDVEISLDDEFSVNIVQNGFTTQIEDLSGGEKTSVALAYRLALNKVVNDLVPMVKTKDLIILDEPTDGFSSEQLDKVRDILRALDMRQTIIVSHETKMESYVENVIRIEKREGISQIA